jgi:peptidyl-prolyl cis-trans isomerase B (cyclophilin B)
MLMVLAVLMVMGCADKKEVVIFETPYGEMTAILYDETPIHKENFLKLARSGQYDSVLFHRVIENFMIQTGDLSTGAAEKDADYRLDAEFMSDKYFHEKGALAAARRGDESNPKKQSSGSQFYIVQGETYDEAGLKLRAERRQFLKLYGLFQRAIKNDDRASELNEKWAYHVNRYQEDSTYDFGAAQQGLILNSQPILETIYGPLDDPGYTDQQRKVYADKGGTPHLDGEYTVFGKVIDGLDVIDKIAAQATDDRDRPLEEIRLKVRVEEMSQAEFDSRYGQSINK